MKIERRKFTDRFLKSLKAADKLYEVFDTIPGFGIRVSPKGKLTFFLLARYGGAKQPSRRRIAVYSPLIEGSLSKARETASRWQALLADGIDPVAARRQAQAANIQKQQNTFEAVARDFIAKHVESKRTAKVIKADLETKFISRWGNRPITAITQEDVISVIQEIVDSGHRAQAFNSLGHIRKLFNWATARPAYGLDRRSPVDRFDVVNIIGSKAHRSRTLDEIELRAFWKATGELSYPWGPLYRLLALTMQRMGEIGRSSWPEYKLSERIICIPADRMKAGVEHICPLSDAAMEILDGLPRFKGGFVFSTTFGQSPAQSYSHAKQKLDTLVVKNLRAFATEAGGDAATVTLAPFVIHDLRRTGRSGLSRLRVPEEVKERVLAHLPQGVKKRYDWYDFLDEKREALDMWARRLRDIVEPPPANIIQLRA